MTTPTFDRPLTEDETALLNHILTWGSKGYPIKKYGRKWFWSFRSVEAPRVYTTKREAVASFEQHYAALRDCKRAAAMRAAQLDAQERDTLQATGSAKREREAAQLVQVPCIFCYTATPHVQHATLAEIAKIETLFEEEAAQRSEVARAEQNIAETQHRIAIYQQRREARTLEGRARAALIDLQLVLCREVAELNRIRAEIVMLTPRGMKAQRSTLRPNADQIEFVRI